MARRIFFSCLLGCALGGEVLYAAEAPTAAPANSSPDESAQRIERLIRQLGDADFFVRDQAQQALAEIGFDAFDALSAATIDEDLEIASRARYLLKLIRVQWATAEDSEQVRRLMADYDSQTTASKMARMRALALLPGLEGAPALCRLARFERTPLLSKQAAMLLMDKRPSDGPPAKDLAGVLRAQTARSARPAVSWLRAWLAEGDAAATAETWKLLAAQERQALLKAPAESEPQIVAALLHYQIAWQQRSGQNEAALGAMRELISIEEGDPDRLLELLDWLIQQRAWGLVEEVAQRFQPQFRDNPVLLYALAQAQLEQGNRLAAEKTAAEALGQHADKEVSTFMTHLATADQLRQRGLFEWAEREARYVIEGLQPNQPMRAMAMTFLSEMLHDQSRDMEAADLLEKVVAQADKQKTPASDFSRRETNETRSRMHYIRSLGLLAKNDKAGAREELEKAITSESMDIDAMIAAANEPDLAEDQRATVKRQIASTTASLEQLIAGDPQNAAQWLNQYAWLVGNTSHERAELQRAINYSRRSLELIPENGGFLDTLAHAYFRMGDFENAVRFQTKAIALEPHSGLIRSEYERFKQKLAETKPAAESTTDAARATVPPPAAAGASKETSPRSASPVAEAPQSSPPAVAPPGAAPPPSAGAESRAQAGTAPAADSPNKR